MQSTRIQKADPVGRCGSLRGFRSLVSLQVRSFLHGLGVRTGAGGVRAVGVALLGVLLAVMIAAYLWLLGSGMAAVGAAGAIPVLALALGSLASVALVFVKAPGTVFGCRDFDLVASWPVPTPVVVAARTAPLYAGGVALSLLATAALYASYLPAAPLGPAVVPVAVACAVLAPLAPVAVSMLASLALTEVASRFRRAGVVQLVLSVVFTAVVMVGAGALGGSFGGMSDAETVTALGDAAGAVSALVAGAYPPAAWAAGAVSGADPAGMLPFAALSLGVPVAVTVLLARCYPAVNAATRGVARHGGKVAAVGRQSSPLCALVIKELRRIGSMPFYAMNDCAGLVLMVVAAGAVAFVGLDGILTSGVIDGVSLTAQEAAALRGQVEAVVPWVFGFCGGISLTAGPSVSLEGRASWLMLTLPVDRATVLASKLLANVAVAVPAVLASFLLLLVGGVGPLLAAECAVCALGMLVGFASLALSLDARRPNFAFTAPVEVIKRGLPVMAGSLGAVAGSLCLGFLSIWVYGAFGSGASTVVTFAASVAVASAGTLVLVRSNETGKPMG